MKLKTRALNRNLQKLMLVGCALAGQQACVFGQQYRSYNGLGNNVANPTFGEAETELIRLTPNAYDDGIATPRGGLESSRLPSARAISNALSAQSSFQVNSVGASDWLW